VPELAAGGSVQNPALRAALPTSKGVLLHWRDSRSEIPFSTAKVQNKMKERDRASTIEQACSFSLDVDVYVEKDREIQILEATHKLLKAARGARPESTNTKLVGLGNYSEYETKLTGVLAFTRRRIYALRRSHNLAMKRLRAQQIDPNSLPPHTPVYNSFQLNSGTIPSLNSVGICHTS